MIYVIPKETKELYTENYKTLMKEIGGFPGGSEVKASTWNAGDLVRSLCWEDPLEKGVATHSSILAWEIPWTEEPSGLQSMGSKRVGHD